MRNPQNRERDLDPEIADIDQRTRSTSRTLANPGVGRSPKLVNRKLVGHRTVVLNDRPDPTAPYFAVSGIEVTNFPQHRTIGADSLDYPRTVPNCPPIERG
jgi:hypothetical protein